MGCSVLYKNKKFSGHFNILPSKAKPTNRYMICAPKLNDEIFDEIKKVNTQINSSIDKLTKQTKHSGKIHKTVSVGLNKRRDHFHSSLDELIKKKSELDRVLHGHHSATGSFQDIRHNVKAAYLDYLM